MNAVTVLFGCGAGVMALIMFHLARKDWVNQKLTRGLTLTQIRDVQPGLCTVEGVVENGDTIPTAYTQTPSVWHRWEATERRKREKSATYYETSLGSGEQKCPFVLRDNSGTISVTPAGGRTATYPHQRILKSLSGKRTSLRDRMKKMKETDRKQYPEGGKKPFFRKLEMDAPLDIPDDLVEIPSGSKEAKQAFRKYYESWVQPGDRVFLLGTASQTSGSSNLTVRKSGRAPLILSYRREDLTAKRFQRNFIVEFLSGIAFAALCLFIFLY
ncbi:MAG: hypothetical protein DRG82_01815 [Deltaproteobacteria bacterium]|nr:MAG: hypothetical protein B1H13_04315 [Desulfobacteraceae bacterium 4484_190.3]RLB19256.1 MAG: hypothetical protein DRG82_01815 [Deltaproteobacteria bacterium]